MLYNIYMRLPEFTFGEERKGVKHLAPDIPEQLVIAKKIDLFLESAFIDGIEPEQRTRILKDYRSIQPGGGTTHVSVGYSDTQEGRFTAEIQTFAQPAGIKSHYSLLGDGETWLRTSKTTRGKALGHTALDSQMMLEEMLEYSPVDGVVSDLQDSEAPARSLVTSMFTDMNRGAHYKAGSDHYKTVIPFYTHDGSFTSARQIELIDGRVNNRIERSLSVAALTNFMLGPVDINQKLVYGVYTTSDGSIKSDGIQLIHTSSDGWSPQALANLAESSDVVHRRIDILHKALDDLSSTTLKAS